MWRIYRNSLVEKGRRLPTVNEVNGKEGVRRLLGCFQRGRVDASELRGIISVTPGRKGNGLSRRTTFRWASVTREEKKRLRAEQTEERVPRMKQE